MTRLARAGVAVGIVAAVVVASAAGGAAWALRELQRPYAAWRGEAVEVVFERGTSAGAMLERLESAGVLRRADLLRGWLAWKGGAARLKAGEYRFERAASPLEVLDRLQRGDVLLHPVTFPEGLNVDEIVQRLVEAGFGPVDELRAVFRDPEPIRDMDGAAEDLEGYVFPDTYHFPRGATSREIMLATVGRFREVVGPDYAQRAAQVGLDLRGAVTLASLIEKETSVPEERPRISRVFHNRLKRGMKLECDPTVIYAIARTGRVVERLTYADLKFDSAWNTYRVWGLPAGPIANPGGASLEAALSPVPGDELYFVAAPGGGHRFSKTLKGHLRAVAEWRRYVKSSR